MTIAMHTDPGSAGAASSSNWGQDIMNLLNMGSDVYGIYSAASQQGKANTVYQQSNPFGGYRPIYGQMLLDLIQNPDSVTKLPGYNFQLDQGIQAIDRSAAAPGGKGLGSGGEMMDLEKYGQGLASNYYNQQVDTLAKLAGADINPANPAQALAAGQEASAGTGASVTNLLSSLPKDISTIKDLYSLFEGPKAAGGEAAPVASAAGEVGADAFAMYGSGAAADAAVASTVAPEVSSELATNAAAIEASNDAALGASAASQGGGAAAAASATPAYSSAATLGYAVAPVAAFAAMYLGGNALAKDLAGPNNDWNIRDINDLISKVKQGVQSGAINPSMTTAGSFNPINANGSTNAQSMQAMQALMQLQVGNFGQASNYVQQQLSSMGFAPLPKTATSKGAGSDLGSKLVHKV